MNLESASKKAKNTPIEDLSMDDFDFKPITSGLGFHHPKAAEARPAFMEKNIPTAVITPSTPVSAPRKEMNVYQNDLSLFYTGGQSQVSNPANAPVATPVIEERAEVIYELASRTHRVIAYVMDIFLVAAVVGLVLTIMARTISMDLVEVWTAFPNEITPLVIILFSGFYLIYFSVFEKAPGSTMGKNMMGLKVVNLRNETQSFTSLFFRSIITLVNFLSFGLFAWFDLQNKVTDSKVIRVK